MVSQILVRNLIHWQLAHIDLALSSLTLLAGCLRHTSSIIRLPSFKIFTLFPLITCASWALAATNPETSFDWDSGYLKECQTVCVEVIEYYASKLRK